MPDIITPFNLEQLLLLIQSTLRNSATLSYIDDSSIVVLDDKDKGTTPEFKNYLIRLAAPETGFVVKVPKIGRYFTNNYIVAIELWAKAPHNVAMGVNRLFSGSLTARQQKGIFEFFQDVSTVLEHNTFNDQLDVYPGSNIGDPVSLSDATKNLSGIGFMWLGRQNNIN